MVAINKSGKVRARSYEGFSSHVRHGPELIYEINNIFFFRGEVGGWWLHREPTEKIRRRRGGRGWTSKGKGETHKAAYVSSVMRTGDFSFRACECKRKMNVFPSFLPSFLSFRPLSAVCDRRFTRLLASGWLRGWSRLPPILRWVRCLFSLFFLRIRNGDDILGFELKRITRSCT